MEKQIVKLKESDLHTVIREAVNKIINEVKEGPYWYCEFEDGDGNITPKIIFAKTTPGAFKHSMEMGIRIGMEPKYETLRGATTQEIRTFKKMINKRAKENGGI